MSETDPGHRIAMRRDDLRDFPHFAVPDGYALHWYRPGDEVAWREIHVVADPLHSFTPETFAAQFGSDVHRLAARQCFLTTVDGTPIGTATAWCGDEPWGREIGRVHWMAIRPEHQGRGLASSLLTAVLDRLVELGHRMAYLTTSTARLPAVNLYLKFGFEPAIRRPEEVEAWRRLETEVNYPIPLPRRDRPPGSR